MSQQSEFEPLYGWEKGVVWAADVQPERFVEIVEQIGPEEGLVAVKIGLEVGLGLTLAEAVKIVRANSSAHVQYDHQKGGTDTPHTSPNFTRAMVRADVDSAIIFPFAGPQTQEAWTRSLQSEGIGVFTGAEMTHSKFNKKDGGYIGKAALKRIIDLAVDLEVENFILPGNNAKSIRYWRNRIERRTSNTYAVASPGLVSQGGDITKSGKAAGVIWHPIMGRAIHANSAMTPTEAVKHYTRVLRKVGN